MAACKICGCSGWFFPLSKAGLCHTCAHLVAMEVAQRRDAIRDSARLAEQTADPHSKLARLDVMLSNLDALAKFEERGIPTGEGAASPSQSLKAGKAQRDSLLIETAKKALDDAMAKVQAAPSPEAKLALYNTLLLKLSEYKAKADDGGPLSALERKVKDSTIQIQLNIRLEKAREAERRKDGKAALKLYEEALTYLKASGMDAESRARHAVKINGRVKELRGRRG